MSFMECIGWVASGLVCGVLIVGAIDWLRGKPPKNVF
jgi:hypothetical protein